LAGVSPDSGAVFFSSEPSPPSGEDSFDAEEPSVSVDDSLDSGAVFVSSESSPSLGESVGDEELSESLAGVSPDSGAVFSSSEPSAPVFFAEDGVEGSLEDSDGVADGVASEGALGADSDEAFDVEESVRSSSPVGVGGVFDSSDEDDCVEVPEAEPVESSVELEDSLVEDGSVADSFSFELASSETSRR